MKTEEENSIILLYGITVILNNYQYCHVSKVGIQMCFIYTSIMIFFKCNIIVDMYIYLYTHTQFAVPNIYFL